jgi:ATP-binding cassette subfamily C protein CydCD
VLAWRGSRRGEPSFVTERAALSDEVVADLQSARQLVLWQADVAAVARVGEISGNLAKAATATAAALTSARALLLACTGVAVVAAAWLTAPGLAAGSVSGPMTAMLVLLPLALHDVLATLPEAGVLAVRTRAARLRLAALEDIRPAVIEPERAVSLTGPCDVRLADVTVGWDDRPVLNGLDLHLAPGQALGVVGPSGCGKSTLAAVLVRHLAPHDGSYLLDEVDAQRAGSVEVRRHVGLVDDDPYVFASSVRENLRLASPEAPDVVLVQALGDAGLADWFATLPQGLDTLLGDGASGVSGGERARIGIARALLADPDVLVLDEPTAHLDTATARAVTDTLLAARGDAERARSLVWVTHEDVGLAEMDRVLTLEPAPRTDRSGALEHSVADRPFTER